MKGCLCLPAPGKRGGREWSVGSGQLKDRIYRINRIPDRREGHVQTNQKKRSQGVADS